MKYEVLHSEAVEPFTVEASAEERFDVLIVGSGITGLRAAVEILDGGDYSLCVVTKNSLDECASRYAQGGVACALGPGDTPRAHYEDTLKAGDGLCNKQAARILTDEIGDRIAELMQWGCSFDTAGGDLMLGREAAHSKSRILHYQDSSGKEMERCLLSRIKDYHVNVRDNLFCVDFVECEGEVGVLSLDNSGGFNVLKAKIALLAAGGAGRAL